MPCRRGLPGIGAGAGAGAGADTAAGVTGETGPEAETCAARQVIVHENPPANPVARLGGAGAAAAAATDIVGAQVRAAIVQVQNAAAAPDAAAVAA